MIMMFLVSIITLKKTNAQNGLQPIGFWREHLNYKTTKQVIKGDKIYCATTNAVFSVNENEEEQRYSKVTGLSDIGVSCIGFDSTTQQLVIAYNSGNVDIVSNNNTRNISDIVRSRIIGNKTINNIFCKNGIAYLSSGLGIILVDLKRFEIKDTWIIGNNGNQTNINNLIVDNAFFYAATAEGLKRISVTNTNLSNFSNWLNLSGSNGLSAGAIQNIVMQNNNPCVLKNDSLFLLTSQGWSLFYTDINWQILNITSTENKIIVCQRTTAGTSRVLQLNASGSVEKIIEQAGIISFPKSAIIDKGAIYTADFFGGLSKYTNIFSRYIPSGPLGVSSGEMFVQNDTLFTAAGNINNAWNYQFNRNGIFKFHRDEWTAIGNINQPILDSVFDFLSIAKDPVNNSLWAGSFGGGLVNINGTTIKIFKQSSSLQPAIGDPNNYRVGGLSFDKNNNLWMSNYGTTLGLSVRKADGNFKAFGIPYQYFDNALGQVLVDDDNQVWIVSPRGNGVFCYNYGSNIDALNDDKWKFFRTGRGNGNLPSNIVFCTAKDKNGFIWIGTAKGIGIVQCPSEIFTQNCEAILPIVQQDLFAGFLFQDEEVHAIAIDGANRKWIGTKNGVWLISPDGDKIIYRFSEDNSPLLSNDIKNIAIDPTTGEVYIATALGICSFRSTATETTETNNGVLVFPNPVPPNFSGTIAIRGVPNNSITKITELNGRLVFEARSNGTQTTWNGRNYKGEKVAAGVYLVFVKDDAGKEKLVTKIVYISN